MNHWRSGKLRHFRQEISKLWLFFLFPISAIVLTIEVFELKNFTRGFEDPLYFFEKKKHQKVNTKGPSDKIVSPFWGLCSYVWPQNLWWLNEPLPNVLKCSYHLWLTGLNKNTNVFFLTLQDTPFLLNLKKNKIIITKWKVQQQNFSNLLEHGNQTSKENYISSWPNISWR